MSKQLEFNINVIESNWQVALMVPTEILAKQHYNLATKIFKSTDVVIKLLWQRIPNQIVSKIENWNGGRYLI